MSYYIMSYFGAAFRGFRGWPSGVFDAYVQGDLLLVILIYYTIIVILVACSIILVILCLLYLLLVRLYYYYLSNTPFELWRRRGGTITAIFSRLPYSRFQSLELGQTIVQSLSNSLSYLKGPPTHLSFVQTLD